MAVFFRTMNSVTPRIKCDLCFPRSQPVQTWSWTDLYWTAIERMERKNAFKMLTVGEWCRGRGATPLRSGGVLLAGVTSNLEVAQTFHMHLSCAFSLKLTNGSDMDFSSWNNTESNLLCHACCCPGKKPSYLLLCDCVTPAPSSVSLLCNMNARYLESSPSCPYTPHY